MAQVVDSMTVIIHGTFSKGGFWHRPGSEFHRYIRRNGFSDAYTGDDFFFWSGKKTDAARQRAAEELVDWCKNHPARQLRIIGHSHGANVANLATQMGLQVCTLILLSPPALRRYLPNLDVISSRNFFTVHPTRDLVVEGVPGAKPDYQSFSSLKTHETVVWSGPIGHWTSTQVRRWELHDIAQQVTTICGETSRLRNVTGKKMKSAGRTRRGKSQK